MNITNNKLVAILGILDSILILLSSYMFVVDGLNTVFQKWIFTFILLFIWNLLALNLSLYKAFFNGGLFGKSKILVKMFALFSGFTLSMGLFLNGPFESKLSLIYFLVVFMTLKMGSNHFMVLCFRYLFKKKAPSSRTALLVGTGDNFSKLQNYYTGSLELGYRIIGAIDKNNEGLEHFDVMEKFLSSNVFLDEVIVTLPYYWSMDDVKKTIQICDYHGVRVKYIPDYSFLDFTQSGIGAEVYNNMLIVSLRQNSLDRLPNLIFKRVFDIVFSTMVLLFTSPLFLAISVLIKIDSKGPIFYRPIRIGRNGKEFEMYKFRSMMANDPADGGKRSTLANDSRITKIGAILRKTSLDELPQFLNVLFGQMSVVGPRPHRKYLDKQLQSEIKNYMLRHYLKPGITGWAQVNGWRGPTETMEQKTNRTLCDLYYIENWSFWLDMKIIWLTLFSKKTHKLAF